MNKIHNWLRIFLLTLLTLPVNFIYSQSLWGNFEVGAGRSFMDHSFQHNDFYRQIIYTAYLLPSISAGIGYKFNESIGIELAYLHQYQKNSVSTKYPEPFYFEWASDIKGSFSSLNLYLFYDQLIFKRFSIRPSIGMGITEYNCCTSAARFDIKMDTLSVNIVNKIITNVEASKVLPLISGELAILYKLDPYNSIYLSASYQTAFKRFNEWNFEYQSKNTSFNEYGIFSNFGERLDYRIGYNYYIHSFEKEKKAEHKDLLNEFNILYFEGAGIAGTFSINYERIVKSFRSYNLSARIGTGLDLIPHSQTFAFPFSINNSLGRNFSHLEADIGVLITKEKLPHSNLVATGKYIFSGFGYKYLRPTGGLFFKAMVYPIGYPFGKLGEDKVPGLVYDTRIGVGIGYSF